MSRRSLLRRRALPLLAAVMLPTGLTAIPSAHASGSTTVEVVHVLNAVEDVSVASHSDETMPAPPGNELLFLGAFPDSTRGRAYVRFDTSRLPAGVVTSATLRLANYSAPSCGSQTGEGIEVRRVVEPWTDGFLHWGNKPGSTPDDAYIAAAECDVPAEQVEWPVTGIVQDWVDGTSNYGFVLQHPDETLDDGYSRLASVQNTELAPPRLTVTMTVSSAPAFRRVVMQPLSTDESTLIATAPRFVMVMDDPIGGWLSGEFEIEHDPSAGQSGQIWSGFSAWARSGRQSMVQTPPAGLLQDGWHVRWRARARNLDAGTVSDWLPWQHVVVDIAAPEIHSPEVVPSTRTDGTTVITSLTPELRAVVNHPYSDLWVVNFEIEHDPDAPGQGTGPIWGGGYKPGNMANGVKKAVVPSGLLADGWKIRWRVTATSKALVTVSSDWQKATVDAES
ncbi:DNRLRE domain-containing protein [Herbidospora sp. NBRC 101105]|uniref:DNRLRE domain-containing protein n=1 Tax=Herbidospora sp. NBRC 101105 TaxID=3032195 RepID=UPI0024A53B48|nr:DNRLRE domain-containing protein [Herbidospora sp. NBRC 101105]GLX94087.1 hypothetical protein Hesp01_20370 [Herbidospora sp. NBRC 101105]